MTRPYDLATASYAAGGSGAYGYDGAGNRTSATVGGTTTSYTANALNQYTAVSGSTAPAYDANGNITGFGGATFTHRAADSRLMGATKGADTVTFTRDAQGRVMTRTINGMKTYFVYDGWNLVAEFEFEPNPVLKTIYIHGPHTDEMLAKIDTTGVVYYHENALGSMVALSDASGNAVERYTYDVYGQPTIRNASGGVIPSTTYGNRFLFTGREWIKELGIYDYRNRMYSAELGRFLETDPIGFDAGDVNIYRYVAGDPLNWTDYIGFAKSVGRCEVYLYVGGGTPSGIQWDTQECSAAGSVSCWPDSNNSTIPVDRRIPHLPKHNDNMNTRGRPLDDRMLDGLNDPNPRDPQEAEDGEHDWAKAMANAMKEWRKRDWSFVGGNVVVSKSNTPLK